MQSATGVTCTMACMSRAGREPGFKKQNQDNCFAFEKYITNEQSLFGAFDGHGPNGMPSSCARLGQPHNATHDLMCSPSETCASRLDRTKAAPHYNAEQSALPCAAMTTWVEPELFKASLQQCHVALCVYISCMGMMEQSYVNMTVSPSHPFYIICCI